MNNSINGDGKLINPKSIAVAHPKLLKYWNYDKNINLNPYELTYGSNKIAYWKHDDHEWTRAIKNQYHTNECKICTMIKQQAQVYKIFVIKNGSIAKIYPKLIKLWDYSLNSDSPDNIFYNTTRKFWWMCSLEHSWLQRPTFLEKYSNCPYCNNRLLLSGFNDLESVNPKIAKKYSTKNKLMVSELLYNESNNKKYFWTCDTCKSDYSSSIKDFLTGFKKCSNCSATGVTSKGQFELSKFIEELGYITENNARIFKENNMELDILIREKDTAIEYNGNYWHSVDFISNKDKTKAKIIREYGLTLITVWEDDWKNNNESIKKALVKYLNIDEIDPILTKHYISNSKDLSKRAAPIKEFRPTKHKRLTIEDCKIIDEQYLRGESGNYIVEKNSFNKSIVFKYITNSKLPEKRWEAIGMDKYRRKVKYSPIMDELYSDYLNGLKIDEIKSKNNFSIKYIELSIEFMKNKNTLDK